MRLTFMLPVAAVLTLLPGASAFAAPVVVTCGPGQHAIVRDGFVRGQPATRVACVSRAGHGSYASRTRYDHLTHYVPPYHATRRRSWGKSALIIGGSAGTGAGIGGIAGGKKGALVGAALGGGVASLYEGRHRR